MRVLGSRNGKTSEGIPHDAGMVAPTSEATGASLARGAGHGLSGIPKTQSHASASERYVDVDWQAKALLALRTQHRTVMTQQELEKLLRQQGHEENTIAFIMKCAAQAPVRKMSGHGGAVREEIVSKKMGGAYTYESRTVESQFARQLERDPEVLAFYPQPCEMELQIGHGPGATRYTHVPDILVITKTKAELQEWKTERDYDSLAEDKPKRYSRVDGVLRDPAAERFATACGVKYRIRSRRELPEIMLENLAYLDDFADPAVQALGAEIKDKVRAVVEANPCLVLSEALEADSSLVVDNWLRAIVEGVVMVDMNVDRIANHSRCFIYRDAPTMDIVKADRVAANRRLAGSCDLTLIDGMTFVLDGRWLKLATHGEKMAYLEDSDGKSLELKIETLVSSYHGKTLKVESVPVLEEQVSEVAEMLVGATAEELQKAQRKLAAIRGAEGAQPASDRTLRHWRRLAAAAEDRGEDAIVAFLPQRLRKGNRKPRILLAHLALIHDVLEKEYFDKHRPQKKAVHQKYVARVAERNAAATEKGETPWAPVSRQTFSLEADRMSDDAHNYARYGKRLAVAMRPNYVAEAYETSVHGVRPFDVVHIDHTQIDDEMISEHDGEPLGRPWLSIAFDANARYVLGWVISFRAPDSSTTLSLLRQVAQTHKRLPVTLVVDNGADLRSRSLDQLCAAYNIVKRLRPPGQPRFGSVCERMFGTLNTQFFHTLRGNTDMMKQVRTVTGKALPADVSCWCLRQLKVVLQIYIDQVYHQNPHPGLDGRSPSLAFEAELKKHGYRASRVVADDQTLQILTCPLVNNYTRVLNRKNGVKVLERQYHAVELMDPRHSGVEVTVRQDPMNLDHVWVQLERCWIKALRTGRTEGRGLNAWEADLYAKELVARKLLSAKEAKDIGRVARESELCNLVAELEKEQHKVFRRLREEGLVTAAEAKKDAKASSPATDQSRDSRAARLPRARAKPVVAANDSLLAPFDNFVGQL